MKSFFGKLSRRSGVNPDHVHAGRVSQHGREAGAASALGAPVLPGSRVGIRDGLDSFARSHESDLEIAETKIETQNPIKHAGENETKNAIKSGLNDKDSQELVRPPIDSMPNSSVSTLVVNEKVSTGKNFTDSDTASHRVIRSDQRSAHASMSRESANEFNGTEIVQGQRSGEKTRHSDIASVEMKDKSLDLTTERIGTSSESFVRGNHRHDGHVMSPAFEDGDTSKQNRDVSKHGKQVPGLSDLAVDTKSPRTIHAAVAMDKLASDGDTNDVIKQDRQHTPYRQDKSEGIKPRQAKIVQSPPWASGSVRYGAIPTAEPQKSKVQTVSVTIGKIEVLVQGANQTKQAPTPQKPQKTTSVSNSSGGFRTSQFSRFHLRG